MRIRKLFRSLAWAKRTGRDNPERLLALLIRAHDIDALEGDTSAAFRQGYAVGFRNGVQSEQRDS